MKHAREDYDRIQDPAGRIPDNEPVFLLRGQDKHFVTMLAIYAGLVAADGGDLDLVRLTWLQLNRGQAWPVKKSPDL